MRRATTLALTVVMTLASGAIRPSAQTPSGSVTAFTGGRLITVDPKPAITDVLILVKDGRVVEAGPPSTISVPAGAKRVNLDGRFVYRE